MKSRDRRISANTDPTHGCEGKQRFHSFSAAEKVMHKTASRRKKRFGAYHCRHCGGFHFGSHTQRTRRKPQSDEVVLI